MNNDRIFGLTIPLKVKTTLLTSLALTYIMIYLYVSYIPWTSSDCVPGMSYSMWQIQCTASSPRATEGHMLSLPYHKQARWLINTAKCCQRSAVHSVPLSESFVFILCRLVLWSPLNTRRNFLTFHVSLWPVSIQIEYIKVNMNHLAKRWTLLCTKKLLLIWGYLS